MDPGWKPAFLSFAKRLAMPWKWWRLEKPIEGTDALLVLRSIWLSLVSSLYLFLVVMSLLSLDSSPGTGFWPIAIALFGCLNLVGIQRLRGKALDDTDKRALRDSYVKFFFIGFALAESSALFAFVVVFITGSLWIYLIGLALATAGMVMIAPSKTNLARFERRLREKGSGLSLTEALRRTSG